MTLQEIAGVISSRWARSDGHTRGRQTLTALASLVLLTALGLQSASAYGQVIRQMSTAIGDPILSAQECLGSGQPSCTVETLSPLLEMTPTNWERFVILRMRGVAYYQLNQLPDAIRDFEAALATGAAVRAEAIDLHINVGQLYLLADQPEAAIPAFENALDSGAEMTLSMSLMLSQAYAQAGRFEEGLEYAELQYEAAAPRERRNYSLLLYYYQQLEDQAGQRTVLSEMAERWPDNTEVAAALQALDQRGD